MLNIDPSKITTPFALATVFLIAIEGLLGYWFSQGADSTERIVAGSIMAVIFLSFLFLIFKPATNKSGSDSPRAFDEKVTPASKEVSAEEMKVIPAAKISGPNGIYTIDAPPDTWKYMEVSLSGLVNENLGFGEQGSIDSGPKNILLLKSNTLIEGIPKPGKTVIDGLLIPTALIAKLPIQLCIIPLERFQLPFYSEYSFEHNVFNYIGGMLQLGVVKMQSNSSGRIKESGREFIQVETMQELEHMDISINQQIIYDSGKVQSNINVIAIKGDIVDHLLVSYYPTFDNKNTGSFVENEIKKLKSLIDSFSPLKNTDPFKMINEMKEKSKATVELLLKEKGNDVFENEFGIVISKIKELNLNNNIDKKRVVMMLKPFKQFSQLIGQNDKDLERLWNSLDEAEKGNDQKLLEEVNELIKDMEEDMEEDMDETSEDGNENKIQPQ